MRRTRRHRVERLRRHIVGRQQTVVLQQVGQGQQTEARAGLFQKVTAISELLVASAVVVHGDLLSVCGLSINWLALSSPVAADVRRL